MKKQHKTAVAVILALAAVVSGTVCVSADYEITAEKAGNIAPIAENIELMTYKNVRVSGTFRATDPNGDAVNFEVTGLPEKGTVEVRDNGRFIFRPFEGKSGKDVFRYIATDENGASSAEAEVSISIRKQSTDVSYSDISEYDSCFEAVRLAESGIFIGEKLGNEYFFRPDEAVSRGEFLSMCMNVADIAPITAVSRTSFGDDESMPLWVKPYVSAALISGFITGYSGEGDKPVFASEADITSAEAAVMLNNVLGLTDVSCVAAETTPVWAVQASGNLSECGIECDATADTLLTRLTAAELLSDAMTLLESREKGFSLRDLLG